MMKDYLAYKLMNEFGVASPLVSYAYVTINGEDWGLFLAVEAVEESFLARNYGTGYGDLYKPDSMSMGGGRGNGRSFDMREMDFDEMGMENPFERGNNDKDNEDESSETDTEAATEASTEGNAGFSFPGGDFPGGDFPVAEALVADLAASGWEAAMPSFSTLTTTRIPIQTYLTVPRPLSPIQTKNV